MMKLKKHEYAFGNSEAYLFWCPGCDELHIFTTFELGKPRWVFNGNMDAPSFIPSLLYPDKKPLCHLYLTDGKITYLNDCGHALSGQTVDLVDIPDEMLW